MAWYGCAIIFHFAPSVKRISSEHFPHEDVKSAGLIEGACEFCIGHYRDKELATKEGLAMLSEVQGHPNIARFVSQGYQIMVI